MKTNVDTSNILITKRLHYVPKKQNPVLGIRMSQEAIDRIDAAVSTGRYRSRGDYIMSAIRLLEELDSQNTSDSKLKEGFSKNIEDESRT